MDVAAIKAVINAVLAAHRAVRTFFLTAGHLLLIFQTRHSAAGDCRIERQNLVARASVSISVASMSC